LARMAVAKCIMAVNDFLAKHLPEALIDVPIGGTWDLFLFYQFIISNPIAAGSYEIQCDIVATRQLGADEGGMIGRERRCREQSVAVSRTAGAAAPARANATSGRHHPRPARTIPRALAVQRSGRPTGPTHRPSPSPTLEPPRHGQSRRLRRASPPHSGRYQIMAAADQGRRQAPRHWLWALSWQDRHDRRSGRGG